MHVIAKRCNELWKKWQSVCSMLWGNSFVCKGINTHLNAYKYKLVSGLIRKRHYALKTRNRKWKSHYSLKCLKLRVANAYIVFLSFINTHTIKKCLFWYFEAWMDKAIIRSCVLLCYWPKQVKIGLQSCCFLSLILSFYVSFSHWNLIYVCNNQTNNKNDYLLSLWSDYCTPKF
jgi:hypothetical protein